MTKREEILQETYLLFAEYGYRISLSQVTSKLGLKKQSIYNYFDSKNDLISEMLEVRIKSYYDGLMNTIYINKDNTPEERINELLKFSMDYFSDPTRARTLRWITLSNVHDGLGAIRTLVNHYESLFQSQLDAIIQEGMDMGQIEAKNVEEVRTLYVVMLMGSIDCVNLFGLKEQDDALVSLLIEKFWAAINA